MLVTGGGVGENRDFKRPFPSYLIVPPFQNESLCKTFHMKIIHLHGNHVMNM